MSKYKLNVNVFLRDRKDQFIIMLIVFLDNKLIVFLDNIDLLGVD